MAMKTEDLTPLVDGVTTVFTTTFPYTPGSLMVYVGTTLQRRGAALGIDDTFYVETSPALGQFTCNEPPSLIVDPINGTIRDQLQVHYEIAGSGDTVIDTGFAAHFRDPTAP